MLFLLEYKFIREYELIYIIKIIFGIENKEEMWNKIEKIGDNCVVSNVFEMKIFIIYGVFLSLNLELIDYIKIDKVFMRILILRLKLWN